MAVLCSHKAFPAGGQQLLLAASSLMCHIKLNDDTYFTFALWPHGQRHGRGKLVDTFLERCQLVNMPDSARVIIWERDPNCDVMHAQWWNYASRKDVKPKKEWDTQSGREREAKRPGSGLSLKRRNLSSPVPTSSRIRWLQNGVSVTKFYLAFFFVCVPPSTPAKEDTRRSRQWRSSRRAGRERREREREKSR